MNGVMQERVCMVEAETFGLDPQQVDGAASAQTLAAWTSLAHLRLIANLEQAFGLRFTVKEMTAMTGVQAIANVLAASGVESS